MLASFQEKITLHLVHGKLLAVFADLTTAELILTSLLTEPIIFFQNRPN